LKLGLLFLRDTIKVKIMEPSSARRHHGPPAKRRSTGTH
jgi:hypothetical protein